MDGEKVQNGVLSVRLAGVETPLQKRAMEELRHRETGLFKGPWIVTIDDVLNRRSTTDKSLPVLMSKTRVPKGRIDLH